MNDKKDKRQLYEILDEALDRVLKGEDINVVLADYPRYADELEPLLKTALDTRNSAALKPRPEFRQRAALDFQKAIREMPVKSKAKTKIVNTSKETRGVFGWGTAWSAAFVVILVVLLSGTGVVTAANYAMPDSPLYSVKLATESVQLALTPSDVGKAELIAQFNDRRVSEVVNMAGKGLAAEINVLNARLTDNMNQISEISARNAGVVYDDNETMLSAMTGTSGASPEQSQANTKTTKTQTAAPAPTMTPSATRPPQTTVASTTRPPATVTTEPSPVAPITQTPKPTTSPAPVVTPTITVVLPPPTIFNIVPPAAESSGLAPDEHVHARNGSENKWEKLEKLLSEKQIKNLRDLLEAYQGAPDSLKPELKEAIKIIVNGYGLPVANIATIYDLLESYGISVGELLQ